MKELPETDDAVAQWCKDIFVAKVVTIFYVAWTCVPRISVIIWKIKGRNEDDFAQYILETNWTQ